MATTNIDAGNIYITTGTVSGNTITHDVNEVVKIESTKIDLTYDNKFSSLPIFVSKGRRGTKIPYARVLDLKQINQAVTVQGFLADEENESAITKRNNLINLGKNKGALTVVWGQSPYQTLWTPNIDPEVNTGIFISKITFTETVGIVGEGILTNPQSERNISIIVSLIRGKDL